MTSRRVQVVWTEFGRQSLRKLPRHIALDIARKSKDLETCDDPTKAHKALTGALFGLYTMTAGRYRALYSVQEDKMENGERVIIVTVQFIYAGIRKEGDKKDVYSLARKLAKLGVIELPGKKT